jgi:glucokinase
LRSLGGPVSGLENGNLIVLGPGTGFGLSLLARTATTAIAVATESGHAALAPNDALECEVLRRLLQQQPRVVVETILSGPGLLRLYGALCSIHDANTAARNAADVTALARSGDAMGKLTVERFCALLGSVAGDAAMGHGARGGVFITGGVADTLAAELERSEFRARFDAKAQYADYVRAIPTSLITRGQPALLGAAVVALGLR